MNQRLVTLLTTLTFIVMGVTGVLAFVRPFSLQIVGLHALMGFVFIALVGFHVANSFQPLRRHLRSKVFWTSLAITSALTIVALLQPAPVKAILGLSGNLGPALERFEMSEEGMLFQYSPAAEYRMSLEVRTGKAYDLESPPAVAIWLENQEAYHIKTLRAPEVPDADQLPYWSFKLKGWEKAKREAEEHGEVDAISSPTPNGSFDPADYILPVEPEDSTPYKLLIEINQPGDVHGSSPDQPSLVYSIEIDNLFPRTFQLLELEGYPKRDDREGKEGWSLYYVDEGFGSALKLIDSALLTIERSAP
jgi:hypothetical protein